MQNEFTGMYIETHCCFSESSFCERVSDEEYTRQMRDGTQQALVDMMNGVLDNIMLSLKEKKQKLRHFQKFHPQLHAQYFSGMI